MRRMPVVFACCFTAVLAVAALCGAEPRARYLAGSRAQAEENYILAIESYRGALAENPAYLEPMTGLAESFFLLEEYDEALRWVEQALRLDRVNTDLAVLKARILIGLERAPEARELLSGVLARFPTTWRRAWRSPSATSPRGKPAPRLHSTRRP